MTINRTIRLTISCACLAAILGAVSCTKTGSSEGCGYIALNVATNPSVERASTRAADGDGVVAVTIYEGSSVVWSCEDASQVTDVITLYSGSYKAVATSGSNGEDAVFDSPFYSCTESFYVYADRITELDLTLTLDQVKVTAAYSSDFDIYFTDYYLSVTNGLGTLDFTKADEGREGYFTVTGALNCTLYLTNTDGDSYELEYDYDEVQARQYYAFSFSIETNDDPDGAGEIIIVIDDTTNEKRYTFNVDVSDPTVTTLYVESADPWAMFATLNGYWSGPQPEDIGFEYREEGTSTWIAANAEVTVTGSEFSAEVRGLSPDTKYEYRAVATDVEGSDAKSFTTESAQTVPNLNFDSWYNTGKYDSPNEDEDHIYWDTANGGTAMANVYPTTKESDHVVSNYAVKMMSESVLGIKLAAGNIYTGQFGSVNAIKMSATLDWGYEFSSRPLALKGWYDYSPATVDWAQDPYSDMEGNPDIGQIQIFLTDWDEPFTIDSANEIYVDFNADYIIARGEMLITGDSNGEYAEFTLPLEYYDTSRTPTYIVITCASSAYGDYFTGGTGSTLYVDEFSLVYDPDELD